MMVMIMMKMVAMVMMLVHIFLNFLIIILLKQLKYEYDVINEYVIIYDDVKYVEVKCVQYDV